MGGITPQVEPNEGNIRPQDDPRGHGMKEFLENNVSYWSVFEQCGNLRKWAVWDGEHKKGDASLDYRTRKPIPKQDDLLKYQPRIEKRQRYPR